MSSSPATPQPVGTPIAWTASPSSDGVFEYQFSGRKGSADFRVLQDFQASSQFVWAVSDSEGNCVLQVIARNKATRETALSQVSFGVTSRLIGTNAILTPTANPLVALYSVPGCAAGSSMYVRFSAAGKSSATTRQPCTPGLSMNFYVAGMLPNTTYNITHVVVTGAAEQTSAIQKFKTGPIDPGLAFPPQSIPHVPDSLTNTSQEILLLDYLSPPGGPYYFPTAVDLQGRVVWYYSALGVPAQNTTYFIRPVPNSQGHMLLIANDPASSPDMGQILREIDLAGNTVAQTNAARVSEQLAAQGKGGILGFDHDAIRLTNGHTLVICSQERMFPAGTQGSTKPVDILGDAIVDLDENWQVAWSWSGYDHLDVSRSSVLGETCSGQPGCPPLTLSSVANDWLHGNSIDYVQAGGELLFSIRNQDWVIKIDYANGRGTGRILWKLGADGDFSIGSTDPYPWFSHQHDARFESKTTILSVFDNGNTRAARNPGTPQNSRGYVLQIDETNRTATALLLTDLGVYSQAVGSAQKLDNGNYHFEAGFVRTPSNQAFAMEVLPDGSRNFTFQDSAQTYRAYRMHSLYSMDLGTSQY